MSDVAIIGAGLAGLTAARALAEAGLEVEIFEARERIGGRAWSEHAGDPIAAELGPEFVHGRVPETIALAHEAVCELEPIADVHHLVRGGRLVAGGDLWARFATMLDAARGLPRDESARAYLERCRFAADDAALFEMLVEGFYAAPLGDVGIQAIARDASGPSGAAQARVAGGYQRLATFLAARIAARGATIHLGAPVRVVYWGGDRVRLDLAGRTATAARAIVTIPIGVLASGALRFRPELGDHAVALARIAMGRVVKLVLCLDEPVWRAHAPADLEFVHGGHGAFPTFWLRSSASAHQLVAWAGGPHADALAGRSLDELVARALDGFAGALVMPRAPLEAAIRHRHFHDWTADPASRGAYSYTRTGGGGAADLLARPLAGRVFFAGEATDGEREGTVGGAIASGLRAARQILAIAT